MSKPTLFVHGEVELAEAVGVPVRNFQKKRAKQLRQNEDWGLNVMRVAYTPLAVSRILDLVTGRAVPAGELADLLEKSLLGSGQKNGAPEPILGRISRFFPNPHLLQVTLPNDAKVNVRVKTTVNFRLGMEAPVRELESGKYELAKKLPRFPGRW